MTVYIITDGRSFCIVFTDREQAERFSEASGNDLFESDVLSEVAGAEFLREYLGDGGTV